MQKYLRATLIVVAALAVATGSVIGRLNGQQRKQDPVNEEATPAVDGVITRRQIEQ
jgi:hypothetical protein